MQLTARVRVAVAEQANAGAAHSPACQAYRHEAVDVPARVDAGFARPASRQSLSASASPAADLHVTVRRSTTAPQADGVSQLSVTQLVPHVVPVQVRVVATPPQFASLTTSLVADEMQAAVRV